VSLLKKVKPVITDRGRHVNAAGVGGKWSFLSGEVCPGVGCAVVVAAPTVRTARCGLTGQKSAEVVVPAGIRFGPGRAERQVRRRNRRCSCRSR